MTWMRGFMVGFLILWPVLQTMIGARD